jgi:hypothetical protein
MNDQKVKQLLAEMLTENTGISLMDSGGASGRNWQKQQGKTAADFEAQPAAYMFYDRDSIETYADLLVSVSLFHFLAARLELDPLCMQFNREFSRMDDWDSGFYGVSKAAAKWLDHAGMIANYKQTQAINTAGYENNLDQVIQFEPITFEGREDMVYVLLQIHGGADIRGGYTDAKLFLIADEYDYGSAVSSLLYVPSVAVYGENADGETVFSVDVSDTEIMDPETGNTLTDAELETEIPAEAVAISAYIDLS